MELVLRAQNNKLTLPRVLPFIKKKATKSNRNSERLGARDPHL